MKKFDRDSPVFWQELSISLMETKSHIEDFSKSPNHLTDYSDDQQLAYHKQEQVIQRIFQSICELDGIVSLIEQSYMTERKEQSPYFETNVFDRAVYNAELLSKLNEEYDKKKL